MLLFLHRYPCIFQAYQPPRAPQSGTHPGYTYHPHDFPMTPADPSIHRHPSESDFPTTYKSSVLPHQIVTQTSQAKSMFSLPARPPAVMSTSSPPPLPPRTARQSQIHQPQVQQQQFITPTLPLSSACQRGKQNAPWSNWGGSAGFTSSSTGNGVSAIGSSQSPSSLPATNSGQVQKYSTLSV